MYERLLKKNAAWDDSFESNLGPKARDKSVTKGNARAKKNVGAAHIFALLQEM